MNSSPQIQTVLVANRGEIAVRIISACHEKNLYTVSVFSDVDQDSLHVSMADCAYALGGETATESYLDIQKIIAAAHATGADAIHPGYGFLSENTQAAQACIEAGLIWIGPYPETISLMGNKISAKQVAKEAGLPLLESIEIVGDDPKIWSDQITSLSFPLLLKAAAGGGGKGMRLVSDLSKLTEEIRTARSEAQASFGDPTIFAETYLSNPRHIEIQIITDMHGNVLSLGERECSIQRRHQKIVEESPSPGISRAFSEKIQDAAICFTQEIANHTKAYIGVGTVEFLVDGDDFYFLEMNTRLQVEHRVTEKIWNCDLVQAQLGISIGQNLNELGFATKLSVNGLSPTNGTTGLSNESPHITDAIRSNGHAIEVRLYAEDPSEGWQAAFGNICAFFLDKDVWPDIHIDTGFRAGDTVSTFYDPMLAKIICHAPTRDVAAQRLSQALRSFHLHGIQTNIDYLIRVLENQDFIAGETTIQFVDTHTDLLQPIVDHDVWIQHLAAVLIARTTCMQSLDTTWGNYPRQWNNVFTQTSTISIEFWGDLYDISYSYSSSRRDLSLMSSLPSQQKWDTLTFTLKKEYDSESNSTHKISFTNTSITEKILPNQRIYVARCTIRWNSIQRSFTQYIWGVDGKTDVKNLHQPLHVGVNSSIDQTHFVIQPRFQDITLQKRDSAPTAPVPGRIIAIPVQINQHVEAGDTLVILEAMKVEHRITTNVSGVVSNIFVSVGENVGTQDVLIELKENPSDE